MIIVEDRFEEMFDVLPLLSNQNGIDPDMEYKSTFGYGDDKELMAYLIKNKNEDIYPLIWLVTPYNEEHGRKKVKLENVSIILAVKTNVYFLNKERIKSTVKDVLEPLTNNVIELFTKSNIFNFDDIYSIVKHLNYFNEKLPGSRETLVSSEQHKTITPWDAFKITFNGTINNNCFNKNIKFTSNGKGTQQL